MDNSKLEEMYKKINAMHRKMIHNACPECFGEIHTIFPVNHIESVWGSCGNCKWNDRKVKDNG